MVTIDGINPQRDPNNRSSGTVFSNGTFGPPVNLGTGGALSLDLTAAAAEFNAILNKAVLIGAFPNWSDITPVQGTGGQIVHGANISLTIKYTFTTPAGKPVTVTDTRGAQF